MSWIALGLSFKVALLGTALAAMVGVALASLLAERRFWGRDALDVLVSAPMVFPPTVLGYYVLVLLGRHSALGQGFEALTGHPIVFTQVGATVAAFLGALPLIVVSARAALEGVDPQLIAAARTLGASPWRAWWSVRLPLAAAGILSGVMLGFARALGDFGVTLMVAGNIPGATQTAALAIYDAIQAGREDDAAGMIIVLTLCAVILLYGTNKLARRSRRLQVET